jgi:hypothetical protein
MTDSSNTKMSARLVAFYLTIAYWAATFPLAWVLTSPSWFNVTWLGLAGLFALPVTIILWIIVLVLRFTRPSLSPARVTIIGITLPVIYSTVVVAVDLRHTRSEQQRYHKWLEQSSAATLTALDDEPLLDTNGPIGVRLRFRVFYPLGLDEGTDHMAGGSVYAPLWRSGGQFLQLRKIVTPSIGGKYPPGTYEITEDLLPAFMPTSYFQTLPAPGLYAPSEHCLRWQSDMTRDGVLNEQPEGFSVSVNITIGQPGAPIQRSTARTYRPADFYATALREGAVDCSN